LSGSDIKKTDPGTHVHATVASINEVHIKNEIIYDNSVASTSREQHILPKMEESIDIKHEPLTSDAENCSLNVVSLSINKWN
jgi:hypothetical protein